MSKIHLLRSALARVVGARVARVRTAQRRVGSSQRRVGGAQHLQHGLPVRHRRHRQVDGLHAVVVDGVDVRAAVHETLDALDVAVRAGLRESREFEEPTIKFWAPHAIDATLLPWPRRLDGVKYHEGILHH